MNFFNDRELARRFNRGDVSKDERYHYVMAYVVVGGISMLLDDLLPPIPSSPLDVASDVLLLIGAVWMTASLYAKNKDGDGRDFVERYFGLGWPVTIQALGVAIVLYLVLGVVAAASQPTDPYHLSLYGQREADRAEAFVKFFALLGTFGFAWVRLSAAFSIAANPYTTPRRVPEQGDLPPAV